MSSAAGRGTEGICTSGVCPQRKDGHTAGGGSASATLRARHHPRGERRGLIRVNRRAWPATEQCTGFPPSGGSTRGRSMRARLGGLVKKNIILLRLLLILLLLLHLLIRLLPLLPVSYTHLTLPTNREV